MSVFLPTHISFRNKRLKTMPVTNLPFVQQEMIRYGMTSYLALGLVGNIFSCIIFSRPLYRRTPSSIYLCSVSICSIIYLLWTITSYIYALDHIDLQTQSLVYCKVRLFGTHNLGQCIRYIVVFACIDRFFVTRTNVRIRALSSPQIALKFVFIICIVCFVIGIHIPIFMDIRGNICGMFGLYKVIYPIYQIMVVGILPPVLMVIFSTLAVHSLHQRHGNQIFARQRDRDFMRMVIAEAMVTVLTAFPSSVNLVYGAVTYNVVDKSAQRLEIEAFITFLTQFIVFFISVIPFYIFILTSKPFRIEFINIFVKCWKKCVARRGQVNPVNDQNEMTTINGRVAPSK